MLYICVSKIIIIGSDNGLSPGWRQAIIWTNAGSLLIWPLGTNLSEILIEIDIFSFNKMHLKVSSWKCRPFRLGLNVLTEWWCHHCAYIYLDSWSYWAISADTSRQIFWNVFFLFARIKAVWISGFVCSIYDLHHCSCLWPWPRVPNVSSWNYNVFKVSHFSVTI